MQLYGYWRSSTAYRVRIALALKGLSYEYISRALLKGEQREEGYMRLNPLGAVPTLVTDEGNALIQSLAIVEWLDETHPAPALLPADPLGRARVRAMALTVATDMHPLGNLRVMQYLESTFGADADAKLTWQQHWQAKGFAAFEKQLNTNRQAGDFCHGTTPTLADICLVPQVYNGLRYKLDMAAYPALMDVYRACEKLPAFQAAHPDRQPDAVTS